MPKYTDVVSSLPVTVPFVGPEAQERALGRPFRARIGANENLFGPSPKAVEAMGKAAAECWKYGDSTSHELREVLAEHHGVAPENILVGEGVDGLLGYLARLVVQPGTPVVTSLGAYPTLNYHVNGFGGILHTVPFRNDAEDPEGLAAKAREVGASLVYLSNPDNPMGTWVKSERIAAMTASMPEGCLLCLDEAYVEFAPAEAVPEIDVADERVIRMRTFSKAYGMAGARIGYAIGHVDLIAMFDRVRNHFGVNKIAQAGALAALRDGSYLAQIVSQVAQIVSQMAQIAEVNGLSCLPSGTNFVAIDCKRDGAFARRVLEALVADGVFVRMPFVAPQDRCIRVTAGPKTEMEIFADALPRALKVAHLDH